MKIIKKFITYIKEDYIAANGLYDHEWGLTREEVIDEIFLGDENIDFHINRGYLYENNNTTFFVFDIVPNIKMNLASSIEIPLHDKYKNEIYTIYNSIKYLYPDVIINTTEAGDYYDIRDIDDIYFNNDYNEEETIAFIIPHEKSFIADMKDTIELWYTFDQNSYIEIQGVYYYIATLDMLSFEIDHFWKRCNDDEILKALEQLDYVMLSTLDYEIDEDDFPHPHDDTYAIVIKPEWFIGVEYLKSLDELVLLNLSEIIRTNN